MDSYDSARALYKPQMPAFFLSLAPATSSLCPLEQTQPIFEMGSYDSARALYKAPMPAFLSLAPTTSGAVRPAPACFLSLAPATSGAARPAMGEVPRPVVRRSTSLSSESSISSTSSYRVLKLAPVHLGEHANDHKQDWHEIAIV